MGRYDKKLREFYKEVLAWVEAGCPEHKSFYKSGALCVLLCNWHHNRGVFHRLMYDYRKLKAKQADLFRDENGCENMFPFGVEAYRLGALARNHYTNPKRLAFLRKQAGEE